VLWQISASKRGGRDANRRKRPKGEKTRSVAVTEVSVTGYPLASAVQGRAAAALAEQAAGLNDEALLFPTRTGLLFHHSSFSTDYLAPAAIAAGWPYDEWEEEYTSRNRKTGSVEQRTRTRRQFVHTWHSHRHRFARTAIDVVDFTAGELMAMGGWENEAVVRNRYYKTGEEHRMSAFAKVGRASWSPDS
jgi:hypothetical protein